MKKTQISKTKDKYSDDLLPEYRFDYSKARPNRFAPYMKGDVLVIELDPDVSRIFTTSESVNRALRALISAMPEAKPRKRTRKAIA